MAGMIESLGGAKPQKKQKNKNVTAMEAAVAAKQKAAPKPAAAPAALAPAGRDQRSGSTAPAAPAKQGPIRVRQSTIDHMKTMGMDKAIAHANSGQGDEEFAEGARRFYGKRIKSQAAYKAASEKAAKRNSRNQ